MIIKMKTDLILAIIFMLAALIALASGVTMLIVSNGNDGVNPCMFACAFSIISNLHRELYYIKK